MSKVGIISCLCMTRDITARGFTAKCYKYADNSVPYICRGR